MRHFDAIMRSLVILCLPQVFYSTDIGHILSELGETSKVDVILLREERRAPRNDHKHVICKIEIFNTNKVDVLD